MGKHHIKCLSCRCEKDDHPELRFFHLPENKERRKLWLNNLKQPDLINKKISNDLRICEKHFTCDMFSRYRLKRIAIPFIINDISSTKTLKVYEDSQSISSESPEGTQIGEINNDGFISEHMPGTSKHALGDELNGTSTYALKDELSGSSKDELPGAPIPNDDNRSFIVPTEHKSIETRIIYVIEDEINKLKKECEELRKENMELRKENAELREEKNSDTFYIKKTKLLLPEGLAHMVESHISNLHNSRQGWSQLDETENRVLEQPTKRRRLPSSDEFGLPNSESPLNNRNEDYEIDIKDEIDIKEEPLVDDNTEEDIKPDIKDLQELDTNASNTQSFLEIKPDPDGNNSKTTEESEEAQLCNKSR